MNLEVQRFAKVDGKNGERLDWKFEGYYTQVKSAIARLVDLAIRNASGLKAMLEEMDRLEESIWGKVRA
ncbi:MAG TPA: hypothetical protein VG944_14630 [Fimbriimonas sp.]|nr:hypothetical protein [Fimbriimonas sp.]